MKFVGFCERSANPPRHNNRDRRGNQVDSNGARTVLLSETVRHHSGNGRYARRLCRRRQNSQNQEVIETLCTGYTGQQCGAQSERHDKYCPATEPIAEVCDKKRRQSIRQLPCHCGKMQLALTELQVTQQRRLYERKDTALRIKDEIVQQ